jgi:hypothetical protein
MLGFPSEPVTTMHRDAVVYKRANRVRRYSQAFHLEKSGQDVAAFFLNISDIVAVGQKELRGASGIPSVAGRRVFVCGMTGSSGCLHV